MSADLRRGLAASVLAFAAMLPSAANGFVRLDDPLYAAYDASLHRFSLEGVLHFFRAPHLGVYAPLSFLSHTLTYHFLGPTPAAAHAVNLLLHAANAFLVFWFLKALSGRANAAFLAAALFAVHPVNVEPVAWATERMTLLCTFFYLSALVAYLWAERRPGWGSEAAVLVLFCAALFSKPFAVTLPAVLVLIDVSVSGRQVLRTSLLKKWPYFLLSAQTVLTTAWAASQPELIPRLYSGEAIGRILLSLYSVAVYAANLIAPFKLSVFYPIDGPPPGLLAAAALAVILGAVAAWRLRVQAPEAAFGALFFLIALLPALPWLQIRHSFIADRYAYLPSAGLFWAAAGLLGKMRLGGAALRVLATLAVGVLALAGFQRATLWHSDRALLEDAVRKYPAGLSAFAYSELGTDYLLRGKHDKAVAWFDVSLRREPSFAPALNNRGYAFIMKGERRKAWEDFNAAIQGDSAYAPAYANRARMEAESGQIEAALSDLDTALLLQPGLAGAGELRNKLRAYSRAAGEP